MSFSTFFEKIFCKLNPRVEMSAEMSPTMSKEISVRVAIKTPEMIGTKLTYTDVGCFSFMITRERTTVNSGIVAFTEKDAIKATRLKFMRHQSFAQTHVQLFSVYHHAQLNEAKERSKHHTHGRRLKLSK